MNNPAPSKLGAGFFRTLQGVAVADCGRGATDVSGSVFGEAFQLAELGLNILEEMFLFGIIRDLDGEVLHPPDQVPDQNLRVCHVISP